MFGKPCEASQRLFEAKLQKDTIIPSRFGALQVFLPKLCSPQLVPNIHLLVETEMSLTISGMRLFTKLYGSLTNLVELMNFN